MGKGDWGNTGNGLLFHKEDLDKIKAQLRIKQKAS
jgi:hypothetical protein